MTFHENMRRVRLDAGLTQAEAALRMGKRQSDWSRWEAGRRKPCVSIAERIAKALEVDVGELFK